MTPSILTTQPGFRVAVTGHRCLDAEASAYVAKAFQIILQQLRKEHPTGLVAISGLAEGADTLFAEQALLQTIALEAMIAADNLVETFAPGPAQARFLELCARSQQIHRLPFRRAGPAAYVALGRALVDAADLLVAAWDGRPAPDPGGTGGVVTYARRCGRPVIHIHTLQHTISRSFSARLLD